MYAASTSWYRALPIGPRATNTTSADTSRLGRRRRKTSRSKRFARLRVTAPPTRRLATTPKRRGPELFATTNATKKRQTSRCPCSYALLNSFPWRILSPGKKPFPRRGLVTPPNDDGPCDGVAPKRPFRLSSACGSGIHESSCAGADSVERFSSFHYLNPKNTIACTQRFPLIQCHSETRHPIAREAICQRHRFSKKTNAFRFSLVR